MTRFMAFVFASFGLLSVSQITVGQLDERILWRFEIPSNTVGAFIGVGADGRIYTSDFIPGDLYALSPDGALLWTAAGAGGGNPIAFAADGTIYTGEVSVFAINPDGTVRWEFTPPPTGYTLRLLAGPNVGPDGNIYAAEHVITGLGLGFFSLDPNGNLRWFDQGDPNVFGLTDGDEVVFGNGRLFGGIHFLRSGPWFTSYCFDLGGSQLWFKGFLPRYFEPTSPPRMLLDGRILYRAGAGSLAAVNPDGFADWIVPHPDGAQKLVTPFVGTDGSIYTGDAFGVQLWSANPDGTTRWVLGGDIYDSLACVGVSPDNSVLVAGGSNYYDGGWIRGFDAGNGELLWQIDLEPEQGVTQLVRSVRPAFSADGDTAYVTTYFGGNGVGHSYLYAIQLGEIVPYDLSVNNLIGGADALFTIEGATPNQNQYLVYSLRGLGSTRVPPLNVTLDLAQPVLLASGRADGNGVFEISVYIPPAGTGRTVWFQCAELNRTSPVVREVVR